MKGLGLSFIVVALTLGLAEASLRVIDWFRPPEPPRNEGRDIFVADSAIGYHLWPSTRTCMRYPPGQHRVFHLVSNSDGFFSSRELGEPDPRPRILVLGDSFTFGIGVEEGQRFTEVIERLEPRWRVDNLGMPGWGLDLMVRALETHGQKARPNVVVLAFYTDDFRRLVPRYGGVGFRLRKFELVGGRLVTKPFPSLNGWRRLRLVEMTRTALERGNRNNYPLNQALVQRFREISAALGATPVILFLPGKGETPEDRERLTQLRSWAESSRILFQDLTPIIHGAGVQQTYIAGNWHWNERGHQAAGEAIHHLLAEQVLRDAAGSVDPGKLPPPPWAVPRTYCADSGSDSTQVVADSSAKLAVHLRPAIGQRSPERTGARLVARSESFTSW